MAMSQAQENRIEYLKRALSVARANYKDMRAKYPARECQPEGSALHFAKAALADALAWPI